MARVRPLFYKCTVIKCTFERTSKTNLERFLDSKLRVLTLSVKKKKETNKTHTHTHTQIKLETKHVLTCFVRSSNKQAKPRFPALHDDRCGLCQQTIDSFVARLNKRKERKERNRSTLPYFQRAIEGSC